MSAATLHKSVLRAIEGALADPRMSIPATAVYSAAVTLISRRLCIVRHRDDIWEYAWPEGTQFLERPRWFASPFDPEGDPLRTEIFFWGYEPKTGDTVIDVGAGLGGEVFSLRARVGPTGRVFGFEAHPSTFSVLQSLCRRNRWDNVEVVNAAVVEASGHLHISDNERYESNTVSTDSGTVVNGLTLDEFVVSREIDHIDYIKMNIEGAERLAIRGMDHVAKITDHLCISCHDFKLDPSPWYRTFHEVQTWMEVHGFQVTNRPDDPRVWVPYYLYGTRLK